MRMPQSEVASWIPLNPKLSPPSGDGAWGRASHVLRPHPLPWGRHPTTTAPVAGVSTTGLWVTFALIVPAASEGSDVNLQEKTSLSN